MTYKITLTETDVATLEWACGRYGWATEFPAPLEVGTHEIRETDVWEWGEAIRQDMKGGHSPFPCLDLSSPTGDKLYLLWDSIV